MKVDIPQINGINIYSDSNATVTYSDGSNNSININDYRSDSSPPEAQVDLGNLGIPRHTSGYVTNFTCDSCKNVYDSKDKGLYYEYIEYSRNICRHCLVQALDKMLGLNINGKSEQVLFQK